MRTALFTLLFFLGCHAVSFAQIMQTPYDNDPPKEYAAHMTDIYTSYLDLTPEQKQQTYITILEKRTTLDSIRSNKIHVDFDVLWALNTSLDKKYKEILTKY